MGGTEQSSVLDSFLRNNHSFHISHFQCAIKFADTLAAVPTEAVLFVELPGAIVLFECPEIHRAIADYNGIAMEITADLYDYCYGRRRMINYSANSKW